MRKALRESDAGVQEIADYLGVSRTAVSSWINGRNRPSRPVLRLWALRTGVPLEWLLDGGLRRAPIRCAVDEDQDDLYDRDDLCDLCDLCWDNEHCDGARPYCCCTCGWDEDWAEKPADLCRSGLGLAA